MQPTRFPCVEKRYWRAYPRTIATHLVATFPIQHRYVLDNSTNFEGKLQRLVNHVSKLVGLPTNLSKRSARYLLRQRPDPSLFPDNIDTRVFHVEKVSVRLAWSFKGTPVDCKDVGTCLALKLFFFYHFVGVLENPR